MTRTRSLSLSSFSVSCFTCLWVLAGCSSSNFVVADNDTGVPADTAEDSVAPVDTSDTAETATVALEIDPANAIVYIDTAAGEPFTPAKLTYKATLHQSDGSTKDVSGTAKFAIDDGTLGTFAGPNFTSTASLPGGKLAASTVVRVTEAKNNAAGSLTVVQIRKTGDKKDFFFVVPYAADPDPKRDVLKFGTNIKQVDVAVVMDTTGSMGGSITNLKTNLSTTLFPNLVKAIPSMGMAVVYHDDYPVTPYGSAGCDTVVSVLQVITSDLTKAQDAANKLTTHCGYDGPEAQIPAMWHVLTGESLTWSGGSVPKHTPAAGTTGGVDFRPGSLPVVVEITDVDWHGEGHTPYTGFPTPVPPDMPQLKKAFKDNNAKFVDVTNGAFTAPEDQANELSDATSSNIPPSAFAGACGSGQCCTGMSGVARAPTGPSGSCRLNFLHNSGAGVSDSIVKAIQALAVGTFFDVTARYSNDPTNPDGVDATQFIKALRAMDEGDSANGCGPAKAKDTDADGVNDTFVGVKVGTPVCFEVLPKMNTAVKPKGTAQFFNAFIDVLGMPGSIKLDRRTVVFLVPPKYGT